MFAGGIISNIQCSMCRYATCRVGTAVDAPGLLMKSGNGAGAATFGVNFVPAGVPLKIKIFSEFAIMHVI